jgi:hypothetical protein
MAKVLPDRDAFFAVTDGCDATSNSSRGHLAFVSLTNRRAHVISVHSWLPR